eukprot:scaffold7017_cov75-Phaeocystis_antarctica.AAC.13
MVVDGREARECHAQDLAHISLRVALPFASRRRLAACAAVPLHHLRVEVAPWQQLHHQVGDAAPLLHIVEQANHVRVAHLAQDLRLASHLLAHEEERDALDRHRAARLQRRRLVHHAEAAAPERLAEAVPAAEGDEAPRLEGVHDARQPVLGQTRPGGARAVHRRRYQLTCQQPRPARALVWRDVEVQEAAARAQPELDEGALLQRPQRSARQLRSALEYRQVGEARERRAGGGGGKHAHLLGVEQACATKRVNFKAVGAALAVEVASLGVKRKQLRRREHDPPPPPVLQHARLLQAPALEQYALMAAADIVR